MSAASRVFQLWKPAAVALVVALLLPSDVSEVLKLSMRAGGRDVSFWLDQAIGLVLLAGFTYVINTLWDRYADATAVKVIGWLVDRLSWLGRPIVRLAVRIAKLIWRRLPPSLREPEGQWQALLLTAWIATSLSLLAQHLHNARDAADQKALHRSELPQLAAGVLHWNWKGACVRPQDGVLSMQLAALPLHLGTLRLSTAEAAGGWTPRAGPPPQSWSAAAASRPPKRCGGGASDLWRMGRAAAAACGRGGCGRWRRARGCRSHGWGAARKRVRLWWWRRCSWSAQRRRRCGVGWAPAVAAGCGLCPTMPRTRRAGRGAACCMRRCGGGCTWAALTGMRGGGERAPLLPGPVAAARCARRAASRLEPPASAARLRRSEVRWPRCCAGAAVG